jgi:mannose-1-phosphate guanylyltransferase
LYTNPHIFNDDDLFQDHCCILHSIIGWHSTIGYWTRVEGTPNDPNPNKPFAKLEIPSMFTDDGRLNPSITVIGKNKNYNNFLLHVVF